MCRPKSNFLNSARFRPPQVYKLLLLSQKSKQNIGGEIFPIYFKTSWNFLARQIVIQLCPYPVKYPEPYPLYKFETPGLFAAIRYPLCI